MTISPNARRPEETFEAYRIRLRQQNALTKMLNEGRVVKAMPQSKRTTRAEFKQKLKLFKRRTKSGARSYTPAVGSIEEAALWFVAYKKKPPQPDNITEVVGLADGPGYE